MAIDGTSGSGKSSTSRGVADRLGLRYLDTGAMYRAMTWWMLRNGVDVDDPEAVADRADEPLILSGTDAAGPDDHRRRRRRRPGDPRGRRQRCGLAGQRRARGPRPDAGAAARDHRGRRAGRGIVVEGRDIGSVVWPDAPVKVFLSADPVARAERRAAEEGGSDVERDPGVAAVARPDRLRPGGLAAGAGRRRGPHRHHAVLPRRGGRPGRRPRGRGGESGVSASRRAAAQRREAPPRGCCCRARPARAGSSPAPDGGARARRRARAGDRAGDPRRPTTSGVADGPLLAMFAPRPVHALTKIEMFKGKTRSVPAAVAARSRSDRLRRRPARRQGLPAGAARRGSGRHLPRGHARRGRVRPVPPRRRLPRAGHRRAGRAGGPVRHPGTRRRQPHSLPERGGSWTWSSARRTPSTPQPWPRTREQVAKASQVLREHLLAHLDRRARR